MGRLSKTGGKTVKKSTGETGMKEKMMSSKTMEKQWKKLWLRRGKNFDGKTMEKSRDYAEEVELNNGKTMEKLRLQWDQYRVVDLGRLQWREK